MAEIVEILTPKSNEARTFTVNTGVTDVAVSSGSIVLYNPALNALFQKGDNFRILSYGVVFPEAYTTWVNTSAADVHNQIILLAVASPSGDLYQIEAFGNSDGRLHFPMENFDLPLDAFVDARISITKQNPPHNYLGENFYLRVTFMSGINTIRVSMAGIPDSEHDKVYPVFPYIKIMHNQDLTAIPP